MDSTSGNFFCYKIQIKAKKIYRKSSVPPGCILNGGTVPPLCISNGGTVSPAEVEKVRSVFGYLWIGAKTFYKNVGVQHEESCFLSLNRF